MAQLRSMPAEQQRRTRYHRLLLLFVLLLAQSVAGRRGNLHIDDEWIFFKVLAPPSVAYVYKAAPAADFGGIFTQKFNRINLVHTEPPESCSPLTNTDAIRGNVALMSRGTCSFVEKAYHAEEAGAMVAIIYDNDETNDSKWIDMIAEGMEYVVSIPALFIVGTDGAQLSRALDESVSDSLEITLPVNYTRFTQNFAPWTMA